MLYNVEHLITQKENQAVGRRTSLYDSHLKAGAKMVDFAGWEMPIQYRSVILEHRTVREDAGMFDVSHMLAVDIKGADAKRFMRYLLAGDIMKCAPGKAMYALMLNDEGGIIDDLIAYYFSDRFIRLIVNAGNRESDLAWMNAKAARFSLEVTACDELAILAVQGPNAREKTDRAFNEALLKKVQGLQPFSVVQSDNWMVARTGYTGEDGYEIVLPNNQAVRLWHALQSQGVEPCGLGVRDTLRLEAGFSLYGQDMNTDTTPIESALMWTVSFTKDRDFIGKKALLARKADVETELVGMVLSGRGVLRSGQTVKDENGQNIGVITSGNYSPTLGESIALARLKKNSKAMTVTIRGKDIPAKRVKFPFVRKGKKVYKETMQSKVMV